MKAIKVLIVLLIAIAIAAFFAFDLNEVLTLEQLKAQHQWLQKSYSNHSALFIGGYLAIYIAMTALSLPGASLLTLAGGAVFGLFMGVILASIASTMGATLAFLSSRLLFRGTVQEKFRDRLGTINRGVERDGAFYLFTLRLVPAVPFFVINLAMGLTQIRTLTFMSVSWIGMLPGTIVYVNAGTQIAKIDSLRSILSLPLIASFVLLGIFPLLARFAVNTYKSRTQMRKFKKPKKFDYDIVVIGAGSAGLVASIVGTTLKAKVALIEKHQMGGDCLNTGCVPSKALIRSAKLAYDIRRASDLGLSETKAEIDLASVMDRVQRVITYIAPVDSVERFTGLGVDCFQGRAKIHSPYEVEIDGNILTTRNIIVASGARPVLPQLPGLDKIAHYTSDNIWSLREAPRHLVVLGGGPIGCELSQSFNRLGIKTSQIERGPRLMQQEDHDVSEMIANRFRKEGVSLYLDHEAIRIDAENNQSFLVCSSPQGEIRIECDALLFALGRRANTTGFGLEDLDVKLTSRGTIESDAFLQTNFPNIFVCGDVTGPYQFTHMASHQAGYAAINALIRPFWRLRANMSVIPWATYTDPEVARVGLSESEAKAKNISYMVSRHELTHLDRAVCDEENTGFIKVLTKPGTDKILGATIVGPRAGDWIAELVLAMKYGIGLNKIMGTIHIYPTLAEANKFVASTWKKQTAPKKILSWLEKFHTFRRG